MLDTDPPAAPGTIAGHRKGRVPRAIRERQILDIAEELFLAKGYEHASIEDICRLAGVSRPIVYDLIGNKAAIYLACVRRARAALEEAMTAAVLSTDDPKERLSRSSEAYFAVLEDDPRRWELLFGKTGVIGELGSGLAAERFRTVEVIGSLLRSYAPDADSERIAAYASLISGAGEQLGRWWLVNRQIPRATIVQYHADFVWSAIRDLRPVARG